MKKAALRYPVLVLVFGVTAIVAFVYWRAVFLPFVSDDFQILRFLQTHDMRNSLQIIFSYKDHLLYPALAFYRPLGQAYIMAMYNLFGPDPLPFHLAALIIHAANSCLVAVVLYAILRDRLISTCVAFVYAAAIAIHLDPLAWGAVGIYDGAAGFFFFLSFWLFLGADRDRLEGILSSNAEANLKLVGSCVAYLLGCLFKEAIILLPVILFSYPLLSSPIKRLKTAILFYWWRAIPFLLIMIAIAACQMAGGSPLDYPSTHPYAIAAGSWVGNLPQYIVWMCQSIFPFLVSKIIPLFLFLFATIFVVARSALVGDKEYVTVRRIVFLLLWVAVGLLPVLFLPNHAYRYYATYSLPAFVSIVFVSAKELLRFSSLKNDKANGVMLALCAAAVISSALQGQRIYRQGISEQTVIDGTNLLISRATTVNIVHTGLQQYMPVAPKGAVIAIGNADLGAFDSAGPQFWYNDGSMRLYDLKNLKNDGQQLFIENPTGPAGKKLFLDASKVFAYKIADGKFIKVSVGR